MHANTIRTAGLSALLLALALAALPGTALADRDRDDDGYHEVHGDRWDGDRRYWRRAPRYKGRVEHHHYYHDAPYYRERYVAPRYYPRYRDNEFTIIYRGGW